MLFLKKEKKKFLPTRKVRGIYYAFGGGLGHLTRSIAILRKLKKIKNIEFIALTNSQFFSYYKKEDIKYHYFSNKKNLEKEVPEFIEDFRPDLLIVDNFPKGIIGELKNIVVKNKFKKILIKRFTKENDFEFENNNYDLIIICERYQYSENSKKVIFTEPILIRDYDEILNCEEARKILKSSKDEKLILGVGSGNGERVENFFNLLVKIKKRIKFENIDLKLTSPYEIKRSESEKFIFNYYPLFEIIRGVDVIIGAGGYNLFYECFVSKTPAIFIPQKRKFDDQFRRTYNYPCANSPEELENILIEKLKEHSKRLKLLIYSQ